MSDAAVNLAAANSSRTECPTDRRRIVDIRRLKSELLALETSAASCRPIVIKPQRRRASSRDAHHERQNLTWKSAQARVRRALDPPLSRGRRRRAWQIRTRGAEHVGRPSAADLAAKSAGERDPRVTEKMIISSEMEREAAAQCRRRTDFLSRAENLRIRNQDLSRPDADWRLIGAKRKARLADRRLAPETCQTDLC